MRKAVAILVLVAMVGFFGGQAVHAEGGALIPDVERGVKDGNIQQEGGA